MRKFVAFGAALTAVLVMAAAAYGAIVQTYAVSLSKSNKSGKAGKVDLNLSATDPAKPGKVPSRATDVILKDPGKYTPTKAPKCNVASAQLAATQCAANTIVGSGEVKAAITNPGIDISRAEGPVNAYNIKPGPGEVARLGIVVNTKTVQGDGPTALPPGIAQLATFDAKFTRKGGKTIISTHVPRIQPLGANSDVILTNFHLILNKNFHKNGKCKVKRHKSKGTMTFNSSFTYSDGTTKSLSAKAKCHK